MPQIKISINEKQLDFLNDYHSYGFKDKSSLVRKSIEHLRKELEIQKLKKSAYLYSEIYSQDSELKELTESAQMDVSLENLSETENETFWAKESLLRHGEMVKGKLKSKPAKLAFKQARALLK